MSISLVTVSDDRFGRKQGLYRTTQYKVNNIIKNSTSLGITKFFDYTIADIFNTDFYRQNKQLLDDPDPSRNGRAYKPYAILESLKKINDGDFIIYTDCSPEMWGHFPYNAIINPQKFSTDTIKYLCERNNGILTAHVPWNFGGPTIHGERGYHTHKNFTMNRCMNKMGLMQYADSLQHASGMWMIQKRADTVQFVEEWLHYNLIDECCSMGWASVPNDHSFWVEEHPQKHGHRHDQSISGLLINKRNGNLVEPPYDFDQWGIHPYNFLHFCRLDYAHTFIPSNPR